MTHKILRFHLGWQGLALAGVLMLAACAPETPQSMVEAGKAAAAKNDLSSAIIHFKGALQKDPKSAELRFLLGQALLASGDAAGAAVELGIAQDGGISADRVVPLRARALLATGEHKRLVSLYGDTALTDKLAVASLKSSLASAWGTLGDTPMSEAALDAALAASPAFPTAVILRARQLTGRRDFDAALAVIDQLLAKDDKVEKAWVFKGDLLALAKHDPKQAISAYRKALELEKADATAHFGLVNALLNANDLPGAKLHLKELKEVLPEHPLTQFVEAQIAFTEGQLGKARELMQQIVKKAPNNLSVIQLAGIIATQSREFVQAETHFTRALQIDPTFDPARLGLAQIYINLGQPAKGLQVLKPALSSGSENPGALSIAGQAELALGDPAAAESYFKQAAKVLPDNASVLTGLAYAHLKGGDPSTAFAEFDSVARKSEDILAEQTAYSARMARREYDLALAVVDQMAKKQPTNPQVLDMRGRVHLALRNYPQARLAFEEELKLDPAQYSATLNLAALDLLDKKPDQARKRLETSIEDYPSSVYPILALATMLADRDAPLDEVRALLAKAIQVAPQVPEPRLQLIALTLRKRLYKEALVAAQEAAAAMPTDFNVMDAVGRAQMEAGDVEQATSTFRKLAGADDKSGLAYMRLADIYNATGKREQAEAMLRKALEAQPGMVVAQAALVDLFITAKRNSDAIEFIRRMQREAPADAAGYAIEAMYHLRLKAVDAGIAAYRTGLNKSGSPALALALHRLYSHTGRREEADRFAASWMKDHPRDGDFAYQVAETEIGRGRLDRAESLMAQLATQYPDNVLVLNNLAYLKFQLGKPGGLPYAQKADKLAPDNPSILDTLANALAADKQFDAALVAQKRAAERAPNIDTIRLHLAQIALLAGDKALAKSEVARLQALGKKFAQQDELARLARSL